MNFEVGDIVRVKKGISPFRLAEKAAIVVRVFKDSQHVFLDFIESDETDMRYEFYEIEHVE